MALTDFTFIDELSMLYVRDNFFHFFVVIKSELGKTCFLGQSLDTLRGWRSWWSPRILWRV
jgi:hypothetical protein